MEEDLHEMARVIRPGIRRLNWNSLGIADYITKCEALLGKFETMTATLHKTAEDIETKLRMVDRAELFKVPVKEDVGGSDASQQPAPLPSCKEFFESMQAERVAEFERLGRQHRSIGPLLTKLEGVIAQSSTGSAAKMRPYYEYWERTIFNRVYAVGI